MTMILYELVVTDGVIFKSSYKAFQGHKVLSGAMNTSQFSTEQPMKIFNSVSQLYFLVTKFVFFAHTDKLVAQ